MLVPGVDSKPRFIPPGVRVQALGTDRGKQKSRFVIMDLAAPAQGVVFTHNNSLPNLLRALGERQFCVEVDGQFVPPPKPTSWGLSDYASAVVKKMPKFSEPISRDEFVALYDGPKRKRYEAAAKALVDRALTERDSTIKVFIKDEKVQSWLKSDPAPRLISPRSPEFCLELGRYIKPIECLLYKAVARVWGETTIAKGLNFNDRGKLIQEKWESFNDPVAVGLDASRFDQHVSVTALQWEHGIYNACYPGSKMLRKLLVQQLRNRAEAYVDDHKISYTVDGGRMSGDMNTALGNCLIMTGLVWTFAKELGVQCKLINDGDDCVVFMEKAELSRFTEELRPWFLARGFSMKVEDPALCIEEIEFCQCHPVFNGEQYTMCRNIAKCLYTDTAHVGRSVEDIRCIRKATSVAGLAWSRGVPVLGSYYQWMDFQSDMDPLRLDHIMRHSGTHWLAKGCTTGSDDVSPEARLSFGRAFGVNPSEQVAIENMFQSLPKSHLEPHNALCYYDPKFHRDHCLRVCESLNLIVNGTS